MNIGSVRMTERHLVTDPPTQAEIDEAIADIDEHIDEAFRTVDAGKARTSSACPVGDHHDRPGHGIEGIRSHRGRWPSTEP